MARNEKMNKKLGIIMINVDNEKPEDGYMFTYHPDRDIMGKIDAILGDNDQVEKIIINGVVYEPGFSIKDLDTETCDKVIWTNDYYKGWTVSIENPMFSGDIMKEVTINGQKFEPVRELKTTVVVSQIETQLVQMLECNACGLYFYSPGIIYTYCPHCGRKIVR